MIPVYIAGCFAVLHPGHGRRGALICGALSDEALNAYRPLVFLAEQLAAAEIPTLRLSYYGTGDSAGDAVAEADADVATDAAEDPAGYAAADVAGDDAVGYEADGDAAPDRFTQWLDGIKAGVAWLHAHGIDAVTLIGYRVGACLAARAACDCPGVDSLVLLNPLGGAQFLHELTLAARISQRVWQTSHPVDDGTWFESHGLRIGHATRDALKALDLRQLPAAPAARVLLLESEIRPVTRPVLDALRHLGSDAAAEAFDDLGRLLRDSHQTEVPAPAFGRIVHWMRALPAPAGACHLPAASDDASLDVGGASELPIRFGPGAALFGILTMPPWLAPDRPAVLLANTSANPRWGNARIAVDIARMLAADGIAVLRMDASGIGDTAPETGDLGRPYAEAMTRDMIDGAAELARRTGRKVAVLGICSGAYHALQAAHRDARIAGVVLVNLQRFVWREGDPPDAVRRTDLRPTQFYLRQVFGLQAWLRLLRADFDVMNLARVLALRLVRRLVAEVDPLLALAFRGATRVGRVRRAMQALGQRGVPVLYLLGRNDPGVAELAEYFGRDGRRLRRQPGVTLRMLSGADHTLSAAPVRAELIGLIRAWVRDAWPLPDAAARRATRAGGGRLRHSWTGAASRP